MHFRVTRMFSVFLIGIVTVLLASELPTIAQDQPPTGRTRLSDILNEVRWNEERGTLLIVTPEKAQLVAGMELPAKEGDTYSLASLQACFERRMMVSGGITVFAPAMMSVMNTRLPKPDIYAGMPPSEKARLLQSSLTDAQWKKLSSEQGIGAGDLNAEQRQLFFAILPNPLKIDTTDRSVIRLPLLSRETPEAANDSTNPPPIIVDASARSQVRISIQKRLQVIADTENGGRVRIPLIPTKPLFVDIGTTAHPASAVEQNNMVFGATLFERVPNRPKPGDLDFDWNGLDGITSLKERTTVGELVTLIREKERLRLYCDPRYANLTVYIRGDRARPGDILRALCLGVTGTIRKVGHAFVLTDDREGFGSRQAALAQWVLSANHKLEQVRLESHNRIALAPWERVGWDDGDPLAPDKALRERMDAFRERHQKLPAQERYKPENEELRVRMGELPSALREAVIREMTAIERHYDSIPASVLAQQPNLAANRPQMKRDFVQVEERAESVLLIPGVGRVPYSVLPVVGFNDWESPRVKDAPPPDVNKWPDTINLSEEPATRILVLSPETEDEAKKAVAEAKRLGYASLWVEVTPEQGSIVEATVKAGKRDGIAVGAVVRVLRSYGAANLPVDRNILGETSLARAEKFAQEPLLRPEFQGIIRHFPDKTQRSMDITYSLGGLTRERRVGPWLSPSSESMAAALANIRKIAQIKGLAAVGLRDLIPPGYPAPDGSQRSEAYNTFSSLGYTEEMRLNFLLQYGVDPIDISPLQNGNIGLPGHLPIPMEFPFFADSGLASKQAGGFLIEGMGTREAQNKWVEYRVGISQKAIRELMKQIRATVPGVSFYWLNDKPYQVSPHMRFAALIGEGEKGIAYLTPAPLPDPSHSRRSNNENADPPRTFVEVARAQGVTKLYSAVYFSPHNDQDRVEDFRRQGSSMVHAKGTDGILVDLSALPVKEAINLLEKMPIRHELPKPTP